MPKEKESISDLKEQLSVLQEKIEKQVQQPTTFEVKELYSWRSPERVFTPRNKKWYTYFFLLLLIIVLVLLFVKQFIIIAPIAALGFVTYVLSSVPPHEVEHRLTTEGVNSSGKSYLWTELYDFWFLKHGEEKLLYIDTYLNYPRRLIILLGEGDVEKIKQIMAQYIPFREIPKTTWMDKVESFVSKHFQKLTG